MNSGSDNSRSGLQTGGQLDAAIVPRNIDLAERHRALGQVDNPNEILTVLAENSGLWHAQNRALIAGKLRRSRQYERAAFGL
jgi:hypothetical protein